MQMPVVMEDGGLGWNIEEITVPWAPSVIVKRCLLCLVPLPPVHDSAVTVSSTDVHNPNANPRHMPVPNMQPARLQ